MARSQRTQALKSECLDDLSSILTAPKHNSQRFPHRRFRNSSKNDNFVAQVDDNLFHSQELEELHATDEAPSLNVTCSNLQNHFANKFKTNMQIRSGLLVFATPPTSQSRFQDDMKFTVVWNATDCLTNELLQTQFVETTHCWRKNGRTITTCANCQTWLASVQMRAEMNTSAHQEHGEGLSKQHHNAKATHNPKTARIHTKCQSRTHPHKMPKSHTSAQNANILI
jgi:hypothetical protein